MRWNLHVGDSTELLKDRSSGPDVHLQQCAVMDVDASFVSHRTILQVIDEIRKLQQDARLVLAGDLLKKVDEYLTTNVDYERKEVKTAVYLLEGELKDSMEELRQRAAECVATLREWHAPDWLTAQTFMGITTFYKYDPDGSLWVKLHGTMEDVRLIDQLATIREVDLFKHWIPFCDKSSLLKRIGIIEVLAYFNTTLPGISRDCVLHAYGCDAVLEENCILIQGRSVDRWEGVDVPEVRGWRHGRVDVRAFRAKIEVLSPTSASTSIVTNIDPRTPLPRSLVNFVLRKVAGMLLYFLQQAAWRITTEEENQHRTRILEDNEFYQRWLYPRVERFYQAMGWTFVHESGGEPNPAMTSPAYHANHATSTSVACRQCYSSRGRRSPFMKSVLGRLRRRNSAPQPDPDPVAIMEQQVTALEVDPRLLEKWRARKNTKLKFGKKPNTPLVRLLLYFGLALCAALGKSAYIWLEQKGSRFRVRVVITVGFTMLTLYVTSFL